MGNSLRCCLACVLPCGALDLIRIVHLNGYVEEITRGVTAGEVLKEYPNHVLSKPSSSQGGMVSKILILSPHTELKRGSIYFLIPQSSLPSHHQQTSSSSSSSSSNSKPKVNTHKVADQQHHHLDQQYNKPKPNPNKEAHHHHHHHHHPINVQADEKCLSLSELNHDHHQHNLNLVICDPNNNSNSNSKSKSGRHKRRRSSRGKSGVWQPHLHSITED